MNSLSIDIEEVLEQNKEQMIRSTTQMVLESFKDKLNYRYSDNVSKIVDEFFETEITPHIKQLLEDNKEEILKACADSAIQVASAMTENITKHAIQNINTDWKMREIMKKLFD